MIFIISCKELYKKVLYQNILVLIHYDILLRHICLNMMQIYVLFKKCLDIVIFQQQRYIHMFLKEKLSKTIDNYIQECKKGIRKMKKYKRVFLIVLDSLGIGDAHDAQQFDDLGANTLGHICEKVGGLDVPCLEGMGLGNIGNFKGIHALKNQLAYTARLEEVSNGKDTMTGHWEMMGLHITKPFKTFTETGFPKEFIELFEEKTGRKCVGNYAESGTKILDDWGEHQIQTGDWIVYTSADSVFQIAANEDIIPLDELYRACEIAREIAMDERWKVGRIIARPYVGKKKGEFVRTANRHDLALKPFGKTVLDSLKENQIEVIGIGKIPDIFVDQGITRKVKTVSNHDGMEKTIEIAKEDFTGVI